MKKYILILFSIISFWSCKETENESIDITVLPSATTTGANTFGCLMDGWVYVGGRYIELTKQLCGEARQDLDENSDFWNRYESRVSEAATRMNDTYLKMNSQADGVKSYGRMVDLMLSYRRIQQRFLNENLINLD